MAGGSLYKGEDDDGAITDINVTPFVDVALVLLVIFMVTARIIVSRGVNVDKPKAVAGGEVASSLRITVDAGGALYVNGATFASDSDGIGLLQAAKAAFTADSHNAGQAPKVVISGDKQAQYGGVMRAIDLVKQAGIDAIALENEAP